MIEKIVALAQKESYPLPPDLHGMTLEQLKDLRTEVQKFEPPE